MSHPDSDDVRSLLITAREERDEARKQLDEWMEWAAVETDASEGDGAEQMRSVISETINAEFERAQAAESQLTALRQELSESVRQASFDGEIARAIAGIVSLGMAPIDLDCITKEEDAAVRRLLAAIREAHLVAYERNLHLPGTPQ